VRISRFATVTSRTPGVVRRLFTPAERDLPAASLAARFAAKEAVVKALGGASSRWHDAEVHTDETGRPQLLLSGRMATIADELGITSWHVSLSHDADVAVAVVLAER
jgi:holo-[acyl-carrier protein] synthase